MTPVRKKRKKGEETVFGVRRLDAALVCRGKSPARRGQEIQSGVEPPHSKKDRL
jgi:hypothetical protein